MLEDGAELYLNIREQDPYPQKPPLSQKANSYLYLNSCVFPLSLSHHFFIPLSHLLCLVVLLPPVLHWLNVASSLAGLTTILGSSEHSPQGRDILGLINLWVVVMSEDSGSILPRFKLLALPPS